MKRECCSFVVSFPKAMGGKFYSPGQTSQDKSEENVTL